MGSFKAMSETEMDIMKIIWEVDSEVTANEILDMYNSTKEKDLKIQTISTFLNRLTNKELLNLKRIGRTNYYSARITLDEYKHNEAQSILNKMYKGSVKNFLSALYNKNVNESELDDIKEWFSKK